MDITTRISHFRAGTSFELKATAKIFLIFVVLVILASLLSGGVFLQPNNLINLGHQNAVLVVVSLAQLLVILTGGIDLSLGALMAINSVLIILFQDYGAIPAILLAGGATALFGLANGWLVTYVRLPSFVVTLGMMQVVYSLAKVFSGGGTVYTGLGGATLAPGIVSFYHASFLGVPLPILTAVVIAVLVALYMRTSIGHFIYAVGGNRKAAFYSGLPVKLVEVLVYTLAGLLTGAAGFLFVTRVGLGDPQAGQWLALDSIAAVSIGGASLAGGVGNVTGTVIGVLILSVLNNIMNLVGVPPTFQPAIKGLVILIAVFLNSARRRE
jgi:ribose transport system permease protein